MGNGEWGMTAGVRCRESVLSDLSLFSGVPHGKAKLVSFVRAECGMDREAWGFRWCESDRSGGV